LFGEAYVTAGKLESVAIWLPLDNLDETPEHDHQAGIDTIPSIVGTEASERFMNIIRFVEAFHQRFRRRQAFVSAVVGSGALTSGSRVGKRNDRSGIAAR
jgi:hypothetical protein